jgi:cyclophilin family peptidyl-prolyl cis-trans isomerase
MATKVASMATTKRERQKAARRQKLEQMERANKRRKMIRRGVITAIVAVLVVGSAALLFAGKSTPTTTTTSTTSTSSTTTTTEISKADEAAQAKANGLAAAAGCPASTLTKVNTLTWKTAPAMTINKSLTYYAHFVTTAGSFVVKLDAATAPITTNNFIFLVDHKFYNCVIFQRAQRGFMFQGGDPTGTGTGGPGYTIPDELPKTGTPTYPLYSVAMANAGPNTGGSQFFIVTGKEGETLQPSYSLFGQVVSGMNVVMKINSEGNPNASSSGIPPLVTNRMLSVTISNSAT